MSIVEPQDPRYQAVVSELMRLRQQLVDIKDAWNAFDITLEDDPDNYEDDDDRYNYDRLSSLIVNDKDIARDEWDAQREVEDNTPYVYDPEPGIQDARHSLQKAQLTGNPITIKQAQDWLDYLLTYPYGGRPTDEAASPDDDEQDDDTPVIEPTRDLAAELAALERTLAGYQALLPQCVSDLDVRMTQGEIEKTQIRIAGLKHLMGVSDE